MVERQARCLNEPMKLSPVTIVHGFADAVAALAKAEAAGGSVTLLSAPAAASHAGCGWWRALVEQAREAHPHVPCIDILDCADAIGQAMAALRIGLSRLVLWPEAPGRDAVVAIAESLGGFVLPVAPTDNPALTTSRAKQRDTSTIRGGSAQPDQRISRTIPPNGDKGRAPG